MHKFKWFCCTKDPVSDPNKSLLLIFNSVLACKVYACLGSIFGVASIVTMLVIGFDRYNVIVKGFSGTKITAGKVGATIFFAH